MKKLLLLDGNSMLFRAYYATLYTHRMTTSNGIPTNAVYGFVMMLNKAIDIIEPDKILVAWDAGKPTFRHKQFEAYKGTRKPLDEELIVQFPIVREYLDAAGIKRYEQEGYEADDIIGSMAKCCKDVQTTILTSDRDLLQLIDSSTHVLLMKKGLSEMDLMDEQNLMDTYGITPSQVIDMKGLMGDTADNIPGVAGVGEKTALRLLNQYSTVENVYAHIDEVKGKLKEKLEKDKDNAFMSLELATIYTKMELPFELCDCEFTGIQDNVNALLQSVQAHKIGADVFEDSLASLLKNYKDEVKISYIFAAPNTAAAYFALFQKLNNYLIFDPLNNKEDIKCFAAVATSLNNYYPDADRSKNLYNIVIKGMKNTRTPQQKVVEIPEEAISETGIIDINLRDMKGNTRKLSELKGKAVIVDFTVYQSAVSATHNYMLRDLYDKYAAQGLEIYQVSLDADEHYWKTTADNLPWICVRDGNGIYSSIAASYNVKNVPSVFLVNKNNELSARGESIKDLEAAVKALL